MGRREEAPGSRLTGQDPCCVPIRTSDDAEKQLAKLDSSVRVRVGRKIDELAQNPRPAGTKKLKGSSDLWRIRVGDYRIVYSIFDDVLLILVVTVGHRREVYR